MFSVLFQEFQAEAKVHNRELYKGNSVFLNKRGNFYENQSTL